MVAAVRAVHRCSAACIMQVVSVSRNATARVYAVPRACSAKEGAVKRVIAVYCRNARERRAPRAASHQGSLVTGTHRTSSVSAQPTGGGGGGGGDGGGGDGRATSVVGGSPATCFDTCTGGCIACGCTVVAVVASTWHGLHDNRKLCWHFTAFMPSPPGAALPFANDTKGSQTGSHTCIGAITSAIGCMAVLSQPRAAFLCSSIPLHDTGVMHASGVGAPLTDRVLAAVRVSSSIYACLQHAFAQSLCLAV